MQSGMIAAKAEQNNNFFVCTRMSKKKKKKKKKKDLVANLQCRMIERALSFYNFWFLAGKASRQFWFGSTLVIVITFYSPTCLGQETAKGPFGIRVKLPPVFHTRRKLQSVPLIAEHQAGKLVNTNFYTLWFDPTGNRTQVYRFSRRRSIHSTADRLGAKARLVLFLKQCLSYLHQFQVWFQIWQ